MKEGYTSILFQSTLYTLKGYTILPIPESQSKELGSRGQVSVTGKINGHEFTTVLEPDGRWSHYMKVSQLLQNLASVKSGDTVEVELTRNEVWPEPTVPEDLTDALKVAPEKVKLKWHDITPMARWEWIRWMSSTASDETRAIRIEKTISKLNGTHRRPCCFNLAASTDPELSKSGRLIEPSLVKKQA